MEVEVYEDFVLALGVDLPGLEPFVGEDIRYVLFVVLAVEFIPLREINREFLLNPLLREHRIYPLILIQIIDILLHTLPHKLLHLYFLLTPQHLLNKVILFHQLRFEQKPLMIRVEVSQLHRIKLPFESLIVDHEDYGEHDFVWAVVTDAQAA